MKVRLDGPGDAGMVMEVTPKLEGEGDDDGRQEQVG